MHITNIKCKNKTDFSEEWLFTLNGCRYIYDTVKPFMTLAGERPGRTCVFAIYPKRAIYPRLAAKEEIEMGRLNQYLPLNPNAPEKSIERFYQLLLLS